jgi:hypothetical protein
MFSPAYTRTLLGRGTLPNNSVVSSGLHVVSQIPFDELPAGFHIMGPLNCSENPGLQCVHNDVRIDGTLTLSHCRFLRSIGENLYVELDCDLTDCPSLLTIGDNFHVGGDLNLSDCNPAIQLPQVGFVGQDLILPLAYDMAGLPANIKIGGGTMVSDSV